MKQSFFVEEMKKITAVFGSQNYPPDRVRLIWQQVEDLSENQFSKIVEHFCADRNINYPPMRKDFIEEAHKIRSSQKEKEIKSFTKMIECPPSDCSALYEFLKKTGAKSIKEAMLKIKGMK